MRAASETERECGPRGSCKAPVAAPVLRQGRKLRRRGATAAAAVLVAAAVAPSAAAFETPSLGGLSLQEEMPVDEKRVRLFLGAAAGTDSNYWLAAAGSPLEEASPVTEMIGGVALLGGNYRRKYEFRYQARLDSYSDGPGTVFRENRAVAGLATHSQKVEFGFRANYASLSDPAVLEAAQRLLGRTQLGYTPEVSFGTGRTEFGLRYVSRSVSYDEQTESYLEHDDDVFGGEFRWWRSEVTQLFVHYDSGAVDYRLNSKSDFDYSRVYAGVRTESPSRRGLEAGIGSQKLDSFSKGSVPPSSRVFATARFTLMPGAGRSKLELGCALIDEASATSAYKSTTMFELRYIRNMKRRLNWSVKLRSEKADLKGFVSGPGTLSRLGAYGLVNLELGPLRKAHGRLYLSAAYETRTGDLPVYDYDRLRVTGGFAIVY